MRAGTFVFLFFLALVVVGVLLEDELLAFTEWIYATGGVGGLGLLAFTADALTSPIPPDLMLLVVATTDLKEKAMWLVPAGGLVSACAGITGWWLGGRLGQHERVRPWLEHFNQRNGDAVKQYARLTVALGAFTPLPFSLTCWSAGAVRMPLRHILPLSLLRVPRYILFYWLIASAGRLSQLL